MTQIRSISSTDAKTNLGELLGSLSTEGPVEITRNGKRVAILSAPPDRLPPTNAHAPDLPDLARLYASGKIAWREVSKETGASFGELLLELGRQGLSLPRVTPNKRPEQSALFWVALGADTDQHSSRAEKGSKL